MSYLDDITFLDGKLKEYHIEHFTGKELCNGWDVPDEYLWNILPTIRVLSILRGSYGKPIFLNSTYRSPEYNKAVGGKPKSLHLEFNAIDFTVTNKKDLPKLWQTLIEWDELENLFDYLPKPKGNFGMEMYDGRFIHLDTRSTLGRKSPARWQAL